MMEKGYVFAMLTVLVVIATVVSATGAADGVVAVRNERSVQEMTNSTSMVLAEGRTRRKDPLDNMNYYTGGWNISNENYFGSVLYTGSSLFLIAMLWFVGFGLFLLLACMCFCCCRRRRYGYSRLAYALSLILLSLFTMAAIIGAVVLYTGQGKFHDSTKDTLDYTLEQAQVTVDNLHDVSSYLESAKSIGVDQVFLPQDVQKNIDHVSTMINSAANTLENATKNNKDDIFRYLDDVRLILIVVAAVMLGLAFVGFLLSICGLQCLVYVLVVFGWILVAMTFILCGVFLVLHNVVGDTCVAMNEWVNNPAAHTALDDIIPCVDPSTAQQTLAQTEEVTFQMTRLVNGIIVNISNVNPPSFVPPPLNYNQSGPLVPPLCNPYNANRTNRTCASGEVGLSNATQVWRNFECQVSSNNTCTTVGRLTPDLYRQMSSAVNVSYGLYHYGPFLTDLVDCSFLRDTFTTIHNSHCPDLRRYSKWVYIGLAMVSTAVMLSLIFWVLYARERRHRKYTKSIDAAAEQAFVQIKG